MSFFCCIQSIRQGAFFVLLYAYDTDKYITHVGIYAGEGVMFEAGGGEVKYTDLNTSYWREHFAGVGRILPEIAQDRDTI